MLRRGLLDLTPNASWRWTLLLVTGLWGLNLPVLKWLTGHFDPVVLAALRMTAGFTFLACLLISQGVRHGLRPLHIGQLMCASVLTVYLYQLAGTEGIHRTTATNSALVSALHPIVASLVALALLGERLQRRGIMGAVLGLAGVAIVVMQQPAAQLQQATLGDALILGSLVIYCIGAVLAQKVLKDVNALTVTVVMQFCGATMLLAHAVLNAWWTAELPRMSASPLPWTVLLLSGALSTGLSVLLWNRVMAAVGMAKASVALYWVPIFAMVAAVVFLDEPLTLWHVLGLALVLAGTRLATRH